MKSYGVQIQLFDMVDNYTDYRRFLTQSTPGSASGIVNKKDTIAGNDEMNRWQTGPALAGQVILLPAGLAGSDMRKYGLPKVGQN